MRTLPLVFTVTGSPAGLVSRVAVSATYLYGEGASKEPRSAGYTAFDGGGGTFAGSIDLTPLGNAPDKVVVEVGVAYDPGSGVQGFTKTIEVKPAAPGLPFHGVYEVPKLLDRQVLISFGFTTPSAGERLAFRWDQLAEGSVVRGEATEVVNDANATKPSSVAAKFNVQPEKDNKVRVRVRGVTKYLALDLVPFDQSFPVETQLIVLREQKNTPTPGKVTLVAESF